MYSRFGRTSPHAEEVVRIVGVNLVDDIRVHCENQSFRFTWHDDQIWCSWSAARTASGGAMRRSRGGGGGGESTTLDQDIVFLRREVSLRILVAASCWTGGRPIARNQLSTAGPGRVLVGRVGDVIWLSAEV